jgi:hypothetical protein
MILALTMRCSAKYSVLARAAATVEAKHCNGKRIHPVRRRKLGLALMRINTLPGAYLLLMIRFDGAGIYWLKNEEEDPANPRSIVNGGHSGRHKDSLR